MCNVIIQGNFYTPNLVFDMLIKYKYLWLYSNISYVDKINNSQASKRNTLSPKRHQNGSAMRKEGQMNSDLITFSKPDNKYTITNRKWVITPTDFNIKGHKIKWLKDLK